MSIFSQCDCEQEKDERGYVKRRFVGGPLDGLDLLVPDEGAYNLQVEGSLHLEHLYLEGKEGTYHYIGIHGYLDGYNPRYTTPQ